MRLLVTHLVMRDVTAQTNQAPRFTWKVSKTKTHAEENLYGIKEPNHKDLFEILLTPTSRYMWHGYMAGVSTLYLIDTPLKVVLYVCSIFR